MKERERRKGDKGREGGREGEGRQKAAIVCNALDDTELEQPVGTQRQL